LWYSQQTKKGMLQTSGGAIRFAMSDSDSQKLPKTWMGMPVLFTTKAAGRRQAANVEAIGSFQENLPPFVYPPAMAGRVTRTNGVDAGAVTLYNAGNGLLRKSLPYDKTNLQMANKPELMPILGQEVDFYPGWNGSSLFLAQVYVRKQKSDNEALQPERNALSHEKRTDLSITTFNKQRHMATDMKVTVELGDINQQSYLPECFRISMAAIQAMEDQRTNQNGVSRAAAYPLYLDPKSLVRATIEPTKNYLNHVETKYAQLWQALHAKFPESEFTTPPTPANQTEAKGNGASQEAGSTPESENKGKKSSASISESTATILEAKLALDETLDALVKQDNDFITYTKYSEWKEVHRKNITGIAHVHVHVNKDQVGAWVQGIQTSIMKGRASGVSAISISTLIHAHATKDNFFHTSTSPIVSPNTGITNITLFSLPIQPFTCNRSSNFITQSVNPNWAGHSKTVVAKWIPSQPTPSRPTVTVSNTDLNDDPPVGLNEEAIIDDIQDQKDLQLKVQFVTKGKKELPVQRFLSTLRTRCFTTVRKLPDMVGPFTQYIIDANDQEEKTCIAKKLLAYEGTFVTDLDAHYLNPDAITLTLTGPRGLNVQELRAATGVQNWALATPYFLRGVATEAVEVVAKVREYVKRTTRMRPPILRIEHAPSGFNQTATRRRDVTENAAIAGFPPKNTSAAILVMTPWFDVISKPGISSSLSLSRHQGKPNSSLPALQWASGAPLQGESFAKPLNSTGNNTSRSYRRLSSQNQWQRWRKPSSTSTRRSSKGKRPTR
jgi:hypothetical protein